MYTTPTFVHYRDQLEPHLLFMFYTHFYGDISINGLLTTNRFCDVMGLLGSVHKDIWEMPT